MSEKNVNEFPQLFPCWNHFAKWMHDARAVDAKFAISEDEEDVIGYREMFFEKDFVFHKADEEAKLN